MSAVDWILGILGGLLLWATQVTPKQVVTHCAEWAATLGMRNPPNWLKSENADRVLRHVGGVLLLWWIVSATVNYLGFDKMPLGAKIAIGSGAALILGGILYSLIAGTASEKKDEKVEAKKPDVILLAEPGRLVFDNKGTTPIYLWGSSTDDEPPALESDSRTVPVGHHYYFLTDRLEARSKQALGENGERMVPFRVFVTDASEKRFTAKFGLLVKVKGGVMTVHTQQLGITEGGWEPKPRPRYTEKEISDLQSALVEAFEVMQMKVSPARDKLRTVYSTLQHEIITNGPAAGIAKLAPLRHEMQESVWPTVNDFIYKRHTAYQNQMRDALAIEQQAKVTPAIDGLIGAIAKLPEKPTSETLGLTSLQFSELNAELLAFDRWISASKERIVSMRDNLRKKGVTGYEKD